MPILVEPAIPEGSFAGVDQRRPYFLSTLVDGLTAALGNGPVRLCTSDLTAMSVRRLREDPVLNRCGSAGRDALERNLLQS